MPPAEFLAHFDDGEDMLLGRGVFDGISVVIIKKKVQKKKYATSTMKRMAFRLICGETFVQWVGQVRDIDIKT